MCAPFARVVWGMTPVARRALMAVALAVAAACHRREVAAGTRAPRGGDATPVAAALLRFVVLDDSTGRPIEGARIIWRSGPGAARQWTSDRFGIATTDPGVVGPTPAAEGRIPVRIAADGYQWRDDTLDVAHVGPMPSVVRMHRTPSDAWLARQPPECPAPSPSSTPMRFCALAARPSLDTTGVARTFGTFGALGAPSHRFAAMVVLDSGGRPVRRRIRPIFHLTRDTTAIVDFLSTLRFSPARVAGHAVESSLVVEVVPMTVDGGVPSEPFAEQAIFPQGVLISAGIRRIEPVRPAPVYSAATILAIKRAVLAQVLPVSEADSGRVTCLGSFTPARYVDVEPELIAALPAGRYVPYSRCPRTYASMFARRDSLGNVERRPPGYLDPATLDFQQVTPWTPTIARVQVRTGVGSSGRMFQCVVYFRGEGRDARVTCGPAGRWVS